jgi:hypothetical protein
MTLAELIYWVKDEKDKKILWGLIKKAHIAKSAKEVVDEIVKEQETKGKEHEED